MFMGRYDDWLVGGDGFELMRKDKDGDDRYLLKDIHDEHEDRGAQKTKKKKEGKKRGQNSNGQH